MKRSSRLALFNFIVPAFVFGSITGVLTAVVVILYKLTAHFAIDLSEKGYAYLRSHLYFLPIVLALLLCLAFLLAFIYKKTPNLRGGGIPTSIGILRGQIAFKWLRNILGVFVLSVSTFLIGVPLGNEGPAVQMGTAVGRGSVYSFAKKHRAWDRYAMTGGACAGFSVATGAPISGIIFAIEEAHQRISPMIMIVSSTAVAFSYITSELLSPIFGVSIELFPSLDLIALSAKDIWIPLAVGGVIGLFSVLLLRFYHVIHRFFNCVLIKVPHQYKIFGVMAITVALGLVSFSFISTGHDLIDLLFDEKIALHMLLLIFISRATLTLSANSTGITGGLFLPILSLGALLSSMIGKGVEAAFGLGHDYYVMILVLGIVACISGMMKTPLTAIVFAVEALSCYKNIFFVIAAAAISYMIVEVFGAQSINDSVLDTRVRELDAGKEIIVVDREVRVQEGAFAIGKEVRDIFWPVNLFVLSVKHQPNRDGTVEAGKAIREGDLLHVHYSTTDTEATSDELFAIVGDEKNE